MHRNPQDIQGILTQLFRVMVQEQQVKAYLAAVAVCEAVQRARLSHIAACQAGH